jgi:patatin-like phospholipase/acyl hydrolase
MGALRVNENRKLPLLEVFRKPDSHIGLAVDGGGIRGTMVAKALEVLETELRNEKDKNGKPILAQNETLKSKIGLFAGTSTGSIIAAACAAGMKTTDIIAEYRNFGKVVFEITYLKSRDDQFKAVYDDLGKIFLHDRGGFKSKVSADMIKKIAKLIFDPPIYDSEKLGKELRAAFSTAFYGNGVLKDILMAQLWNADPQMDLIITVMDLMTYRSRFAKPYNVPDDMSDSEDADDHDHNFTAMKLHEAVLASSAVPLYFPMLAWDGCEFADGGIGAYGNPSYLAAFEIRHRLGDRQYWIDRKLKSPKKIWDPFKTTLISIGTGEPMPLLTKTEKSDDLKFKWIEVILNSFSQSTNRQQREIVKNFFPEIDFRRYNVDFGDADLQKKLGFDKNIEMDDKDAIDVLTGLGDVLGQAMINDNGSN